jgi:hypothetical protein
MSSKRKAGKLAPFIGMDRHQHKSAAFAALSAVAHLGVVIVGEMHEEWLLGDLKS